MDHDFTAVKRHGDTKALIQKHSLHERSKVRNLGVNR